MWNPFQSKSKLALGFLCNKNRTYELGQRPQRTLLGPIYDLTQSCIRTCLSIVVPIVNGEVPCVTRDLSASHMGIKGPADSHLKHVSNAGHKPSVLCLRWCWGLFTILTGERGVPGIHLACSTSKSRTWACCRWHGVMSGHPCPQEGNRSWEGHPQRKPFEVNSQIMALEYTYCPYDNLTSRAL